MVAVGGKRPVPLSVSVGRGHPKDFFRIAFEFFFVLVLEGNCLTL